MISFGIGYKPKSIAWVDACRWVSLADEALYHTVRLYYADFLELDVDELRLLGIEVGVQLMYVLHVNLFPLFDDENF